MIEQIKFYLGEKWKKSFREKAHILFTASTLRDRIARGRSWAENWFVSAKDAAGQTTLFILGGSDELYDWILATLD